MKRAFVLGIDGLPYTLVKRLCDEGVMPNMKALSVLGQLSQLHVTVPDFSCVSWTSFYTGVNPGKHGIYGFTDFNASDASIYISRGSDVKAPALWHEVGKAGGRSVIVNLPHTYPATPLRGKMVSGFVSPEFDKSYYPATFGQTLKTLGYRMDLDGVDGLGFPEQVRERLRPVFEARKTFIRHVIDNEYWDLAIAVITETDRLQHYFLPILDDPDHELYDWILRFYQDLDAFVGEVAEKLDGKAGLFMVSDHGFSVIRHEFHLHKVMQELGLMPPNLPREPWHYPEIAAKCKVFVLDPGRFYINRKNSRFPHGCVDESEVEPIFNMIADAMWNLCDPNTGEKAVNVVKTLADAFHGEETAYAPDLVAGVKPGYYLKACRAEAQDKIKESVWEANHVWSGAIVYTPYKLQSDYQPMIWDVLPSVQKFMSLDLPTHIDGQDLKDMK